MADDRLTGPALPDGKHIRRAGEDAPAGRSLAPAGTPAAPAVLGLAASCGYDDLLVHRAPTVRAVVTGDELVHHGPPSAGRVRDVVVVTGSTSVGATDGLRRLLAERDAHWIVDAVACRPGHPQLLARPPGGPYVVGLPGNPFAAPAAAHTILGPLLAGLSGRPLGALPYASLLAPVPVPAGRTRIVPVAWDGPGVRPLGGDRPAFLNGAALCDALAAIPPGAETGAMVPLLPLRG
ncbi:molybdopterin-binding protein [Actinocorallia herbida]|uniref:molybdopterin-binding protein n=1 Tax=Actinocorallia herbida TaxID=58109 RepID=UPI0011CE5AD6|nr:molybdopterin-binding protein [Actinocorallia herbida]